MREIVFAHGWGYDASFWDAVRARLPASWLTQALDFGYFGAVSPAPSFAGPVIAVAHSLGALWWLTQETIPWQKLLIVNGFPRFTATAGYPGVAPRLLFRMHERFAATPNEVLAEFHRRCGAPGPPGVPDPSRLAAGLLDLARTDARTRLVARRQDVWALAASADPIVPATLSRAAFAPLPEGHFRLVPADGHALPISHPDLVVETLCELCR